MISIFNKKKDLEILIDESIPQVTFTPRDYEEIPNVEIEIRGFAFNHHSLTCNTCKSFSDSFGTTTLDWYIKFMGKTRRLDLSNFGNKFSDNHSNYTNSKFKYDSTLKLNLYPDNKEEIEQRMNSAVELERYEEACIWRDLLKE
jgi:hypothetical protein